MDIKALVALIFAILGPPQSNALRHRAEVAAPLVQHACHATGVDPVVLAAVVMKESSFRSDVRGAAGEIGYGQIKPGRFAEKMCPGLDLHHPGQNMLCTARYLARAQRVCGGPPANYLRLYNGQMCGPSEYADHVLRLMRRAPRREIALR